jgi:asparagine synthase (glutamine-hydrolysing)
LADVCGIAGIVRPNASPEDVSAALDRMLPGIASRGPDGTARFCAPGLGLLHTRLAIIDLVTGDQPMWNEMRTVGCVFNGEIYNYRELTRRLSERHRFATQSDTEVLVHLYEEYGEDLVDHLHGMYAFAIWDEPKRRLVLGRDRLGIKPLYVARLGAGGFAFASAIDSLLDAGASREPDAEALALLLRFHKIPEPRTVCRGVRALPPSHVAVVDTATGAVRERRFHALRRPPREGDGDVRSARQAFERAVGTHLVADVEVAAFLSGGIDSSLVVAQAQRMAGRPLRTFCVSFRGAGSHDESEHAARVAKAIGTRHETIDVATAPADALRDAVRAAQQPFAVTSFVPLLLLCRAAARHVKVVLTGDGGDEVGFGYPWYRWMRAGALLPSSLRSPALASVLRSLERRAGPRAVRRGLKLGRGVLRGDAPGSDSWRYEQTAEEAVALLRPEHRPAAPPRSPFEEAWAGDLDPVDALRRADLEVLLRDEMLPKLDRAGMAHGLEGRVPLLDDDFVDAMIAVPARVHMRDPHGKALLREWARELVPACDVQRPKHGFDVPIRAWLEDGLGAEVKRLLFEERPRGIVDPAAARALWRRVRAGVPGAAHAMYAALMVEWWFEAKGLAG